MSLTIELVAHCAWPTRAEARPIAGKRHRVDCEGGLT
jgi:hypothetical protein